MNLYDIVAPMSIEEAKATSQRLDPKCWTGKHKEGTKVKGGVRVNNCVPNESMEEAIVGGSQHNPADAEVKKIIWDTLHIDKPTAKEALEAAITMLSERPKTRMVQQLLGHLKALADRARIPLDPLMRGILNHYNEDIAEDSWHGEGDAWHGAGDAWSGEGHEMVEYVTQGPSPDDSQSPIHGGMEEGRLNVGDPIVVTAPNEFEGKTGEIAEFSPSGKFVVVNLYNHGEHSMHLSDVEYNQYADDQDADEYSDDEIDEDTGPSPVASAITRRILQQRLDLLKQYGPELVGSAVDEVADYVGDVEEIGSSDVSAWVNQVERMLKENPPEAFAEEAHMYRGPHGHADVDRKGGVTRVTRRDWDDTSKATTDVKGGKYFPNKDIKGQGTGSVASNGTSSLNSIPGGSYRKTPRLDHDANDAPNYDVDEGFQDFNKVEPYAVCLAGKPVKKFDYYEEARRFHDNWKKKLYREGNKEKADKITLMPIMKEATNRHFGPKGAGTELARQIKSNGDLDRTKQPEPTGVYKKNEFDITRPKTKIQVKKNKGVAEGLTEFALSNGDNSDNFDPKLATMAKKEGVVKGYSLVDHATVEQALEIPNCQWGDMYDGQYKQYFVKGFINGRKAKLEQARKDGVALTLQKDGRLSRVQQGVAEMDKSQKGPAGWNIDDYDYSKGKWSRGKIMTAKDAVKSATKDLAAAFDQADKKKPKPVKESYWTKLQNERNTRLNSLVNELAESIKK